MIIGFGQCEKDEAKRVLREVAALAAADEISLKFAADRLSKKSRKEADRLGEMSKEEAPERYSSFWASSLGEDALEFHFMHYNRRHALSPDGWAVLTTKWVLTRDHDGEISMYQEV